MEGVKQTLLSGTGVSRRRRKIHWPLAAFTYKHQPALSGENALLDSFFEPDLQIDCSCN